ncbi:MAG TPA: hypothetical protein VF807_04075 [Ktedonobacterales bacterium]
MAFAVGTMVAANALVLVGAIATVRALRVRGLLAGLLTGFTAAIAQIVGTSLLAGALIQRLTPAMLIALNGLVCVGLLLLAWRFGEPFSRAQVSAYLRRLGGALGEVLMTPWSAALLLLTLANMLWLSVAALIVPPYDWDGLAYHLLAVVTWIQAGKFAFSPHMSNVNFYPFNTELIYDWLAIFPHNGSLVRLGQMIFVVGGMLGLAGICRLFGLSKPIAASAGCLFFLTPIVLAQVNTAYVDVAFASMVIVCFSFILRYAQDGAWQTLLMAGGSGGVELGMKASAVAYVGIALMTLVGLCIARDRASIKRSVRGVAYYAMRLAGTLLLFAGLPILLLGTYWYLRNWATFGNPLYPVTVKLLGHQIFPGRGTFDTYFLSANTPPELASLPPWLQVAYSWLHEPRPGGGESYANDQQIGGFGLQWLIFELPMLVGVSVFSLLKRRGIFLGFFLPFLAIFLAQPANWWSRYTLSFVAIGIFALCYAVERLRLPVVGEVIKWAVVALALVGISLSSIEGRNSPAFVRQALAMPTQERTVGNLNQPQYRWVDSAPRGSRIGYPHLTWDHWEVYALFGSDFSNQVFVISTASREEFLREAQADAIRYYFSSEDAPEIAWLKADPRFHLIDTTWGPRDGQNRVYEVRW